ncbi:hypothetical protein [Hymenobacter bucti]|uniref:HEAT repeat domain-containing protein n=1 Tax=Hymenobacter bucti TaxID=1844114 RepID=A0ABW4QZS3_9BACT
MVAANKLPELVAQFRQWLTANYTAEEIDQLNVDDAGYPHWKEVAAYVTALLAADGVAALTDDEQTDLLYLVARNWDLGWLIAWLSPGEQLSNLGVLKQADFLRLAAKAATLTPREFADAKYQFAVACRKFAALTPELERVLLALYREADDYTKTCALASLAKLRYPAIKDLAQQCWGQVSDEHAQLACLLVLAEHG